MNVLSIIIPIHNRLTLTQQGVRSLHHALARYADVNAGHCRFSVVVVDDGSTDGSSEWLADQYPTIHILKGDGNLWWSGSVNKGARYAVEQLNADFVILWNDDTLCDTDYFVELDAALTRNPVFRCSILASKVYWLNEANTLFNYGCYYSYKTGAKRVIGLNQPDRGQFDEVRSIDWSGGMGTVIPAEILVNLAYFDAHTFPQYHGDIDFFLRAKKLGYPAYAIPTLKIYNNRESTGIAKTRTFKDLGKLLLSNRSNHNIRQNIRFNQRHANSLAGWTHFVSRYAFLTAKSLKTIVLP